MHGWAVGANGDRWLHERKGVRDSQMDAVSGDGCVHAKRSVGMGEGR